MENLITKYLSKYLDLSEELVTALSENLLIREFPKGTILLKEGDLCNECYFILEGLVRSYYIKNGEEITTDFYLEEQVVSPSCYGTETRSGSFLDCLEDTVAFVGNPELENEMYSKYPQLETLSRIIGDKIISSYRDNFETFKMSSPEERYLNLIKYNPGLIQRAPQYQIASYLGIKPESLSRIRKRISNK